VIVRLQNVDKVYSNGVVALRNLDLDVGEGEFLSLLGPSGCGKSTVLRLVAGLGDVSGGRIDWPGGNGRAGLPQGDIGFVFQEPTLMPWSTVFKNVLLPLKLRGLAAEEAAARVREAIEMVGLEGFENAYPRELSGGMKMRVSIWTVVFVTHSVYESVYLSTRIAVMTGRPGRTASEVAIEAPAPRDEAFRTSPLYNEYCRDVSARLAAVIHA
jgi:NitT/TauT family transport system ATP-binding protein